MINASKLVSCQCSVQNESHEGENVSSDNISPLSFFSSIDFTIEQSC